MCWIMFVGAAFGRLLPSIVYCTKYEAADGQWPPLQRADN